MSDVMVWGVCELCGLPFIHEPDWDARHSDIHGNDIHAECCERDGICSDVPD